MTSETTRAHEILVVDDNRPLRLSLRRVFETDGYAVREARNGDEALAAIAERRPDVVLLDVDMPVRGGFSTCEEIRRADPLLPVIFLTAMDSEADMVRGFAQGGDDYIPKSDPFYLQVARASVRRALERSAAFASGGDGARTVKLGRIRVDCAQHRVFDGEREIARLTASETDILRLLASERARHFSYGEILAAVRGENYAADPSTVRSHVCRLRQKLGVAGEMIVGERELGYALLK